MVELADTQVSEACGSNPLGVQVPLSAPNLVIWYLAVTINEIVCCEGIYTFVKIPHRQKLSKLLSDGGAVDYKSRPLQQVS